MKEINRFEIAKMIALAEEARERAYVEYSHFRVGACIKAQSGAYYLGCNIENAAYGPSNCAERTAFFKAVSEGHLKFDAIMIVGGAKQVHTNLICTPARELFEANGVRIFAAEEVPMILNRDRSGMCPMDTRIQEVENIEECVEILQAALAK